MRTVKRPARKPKRAAGRAAGRNVPRSQPAVAPHRAPRKRPVPPPQSRLSRWTEMLMEAVLPHRPLMWLSGALIIFVLIVALFVGGYIRAAERKAAQSATDISNYAGFGISKLRLSGENRTSPQLILDVLNLQPGQSIFSADLANARARLMHLPWVADARVTRRYPDSISVDIVEKRPFALWQSPGGLVVIERSGTPIIHADARDYPKLPVFLGDAPVGGAGLVAAIATRRAVFARTRAMQRVSGRRWNLILDSGVLVKLPEAGWEPQLDVLEHLIVDKGVLERDILEIDLRSPDQFFFVLPGQKVQGPRPRENKV